MNSSEQYHAKIQLGSYYHIYNRSISDTDLFFTEANYTFFLQRLDKYLSKYIEIYAWCLIPNHFHLLAKVKDKEEIEMPFDDLEAEKIITNAFRHFFQSYAQAINQQERRRGPLFEGPFKRKVVDSEEYFTQLIYYIHTNPQHHGMVANALEYRWSSYQSFLSPRETQLKKKEVLEWFSGIDSFKAYHESYRKVVPPKIVIEDARNIHWSNVRR